jgi:hypothetical protein
MDRRSFPVDATLEGNNQHRLIIWSAELLAWFRHAHLANGARIRAFAGKLSNLSSKPVV